MRHLLLPLLWLSLQLPAAAQDSSLPPRWQEIRQDYADKALLEKFYTAFQKGDGAAMAACYHPEAKFSDPVFGSLHGAEIGAMWQMLPELSQGQLRIQFSALDAHLGMGQARWEAWYTFSATGLPVHNRITAEFEFREGLIYRHRDQFDLHRWSSQAMGLPGFLLGQTPGFQSILRQQVRSRLKDWMAARVRP